MTKRRPKRSSARRPRRTQSRRQLVNLLEPDLRAIRKQLARAAGPARWNADPEDVRRSVVKLVLTLVELLRRLMERQTIRRMEQGSLTEEEIEKLGTALMRLEATIREIGEQFGLEPKDLNLDLGPIGKLM